MRNYPAATLIRVLGVAAVLALIAAACGQAASPTTIPPSPTTVSTPAPTATQPATPRATPTRAPVATATGVAATPTPTIALPTATPAAVFGRFGIDTAKIAGIRYPFSKPDFTLTPKNGGTLKAQTSAAWPHFDINQSNTSGTHGALQPVYSKLVVCKGPLEMTSPNPWLCEAGPQLARSWEVSGDGTVWTFHLGQGIKWQDLPPVNGREFTSADVKYTYGLYSQGAHAGVFSVVDKVETPDNYTVRITLKQAFPDFLTSVIAEQGSFILPHEIADRDGDFKQTAVGTGPFKMKKVDGKERITFERNSNYFVRGAPLLGAYEYQIIPDYATQRAVFRSGQAHIGVGGDTLTAKEMQTFVNNAPNAVVYIADSDVAQYGLYVRLDKPPFNDVRVRRAISMAMDRPGIIKDIFEGEASIMQAIPWGYALDVKPTLDQMSYYKYDVKAAKDLLAQAGYANGFKFTANYYPYAAVRQQVAVVQDNLKAIGVQMDLLTQDNTTFNAALRGNFDAAAVGFVFIQASLDGWTYGNMHTGQAGNFGKISDAELDKLLEAQRSQMDAAKRKALARQIFQMDSDQMWRIPFPMPNTILFYSNQLHNYVYHKNMSPPNFFDNVMDYLWVD